ncbi:MAG: F0F1 ATP synthase subunit A [Candidatus Acidiferrales bacterium]
MGHHDTFLTQFLNHWLGEYVAAALAAIGIEGVDPHHAIPDHVVMGAVVVLIGVVLAMILKRRLSVDRPGAFQQICEFLITNPIRFGIRDVLEDNVGHDAPKHLAMVGSVGIFVLLASAISVIPIFNAPTANVTVPLGCALLTYIYFNGAGFRKHGALKYLAHFAGPSPAVAALIFPVEIISVTARVLSLTVRLWANIFASELIYFIFLGMLVMPTQFAWDRIPVLGVIIAIFPATIPIAFIGLHLFVAVVQAFVFTLLPAVYLGMATAEEH